MYSKIIFATDLTTSTIAICKKAVAIASAFSAELYILHVVTLPTSVQYAQALGFAELDIPNVDGAKLVIETLGEQFQIEKEYQLVESGCAKTIILEVAQNIAADLIIIGHHDPSLSNALIGNIAESIVHNAKLDVLTLHKD